MKIKTDSAHVTAADGNVFSDLGFSPEVAHELKDRSQKIVQQKLTDKATQANDTPPHGGTQDGSS